MFLHPKPKVLCVDDEPAVGRLLKAVLELTGNFQLEWEGDALAAVEVAKRFEPDLIILDVNMPGQNGFAVARQLRDEPSLRHLPIIFFSGLLVDSEALRRASEDGPTTFLQKGVPLREILDTVTQVRIERQLVPMSKTFLPKAST
ncbi:MAG: response regulator receiver protein [Chthoniobacter sp.]|nr:response regulator receiver protein [Chthoniobacter sp.]